MLALRSVSKDDIEDLYQLSGKVHFINLPHDKAIISEKLDKSVECFTSPSTELDENYYFFVLEDLEKRKVIGVSMIHAQHGTEREPHFFLKVAHEHKYSQTINTGFVHGTLKLGLDTNGPTEIGGLVVDPDYRGHPDKLGKQISFVRFLYMAMYPKRFRKVIHSELMPPLDADGNSPLWEALGRRFMNMNYSQADVLSRSNKEFILSLFPSENIYMTLLAPEVRESIGKVGKDTLPVKNMLEKIGFKYMNEVDPFDGGPHYRARLQDITPVKKFLKLRLVSEEEIGSGKNEELIISFPHEKYHFFALKIEARVDREKMLISIKNEFCDKFNLNADSQIFSIPFKI